MLGMLDAGSEISTSTRAAGIPFFRMTYGIVSPNLLVDDCICRHQYNLQDRPGICLELKIGMIGGILWIPSLL